MLITTRERLHSTTPDPALLINRGNLFIRFLFANLLRRYMYYVEINLQISCSCLNTLISLKGIYGVPKAYERSFRWKLSQFRFLCQSNQLPSHIKITISRQTLFEDSYHQIMRLPAYELRRRLYIIFRGEEGLDYGGVSRYCYVLVCLNFAFLLSVGDVYSVCMLFSESGFSCYHMLF